MIRPRKNEIPITYKQNLSFLVSTLVILTLHNIVLEEYLSLVIYVCFFNFMDEIYIYIYIYFLFFF